MEKRVRWLFAVGFVAALSAATALAANPKGGASYSGTGKDFMNNAPKWADEGTGKITFQTSKDGSDVLAFSGGFSYYCGAGTSTVTEKKMPVSNGKFGLEFHQPDRGPNGKIEGTAYASISGTFEDGGSEAQVSYLIDYVFTGAKVKHPYSTKNPKALGCATWVRGTVKTK
jgi:hypothetical protein